MPYPPQPTYRQTVPETALEDRLNGIPGGTGNANTIPNTTSGQSGSSPMRPYNNPRRYDFALADSLDDVREIVGTSFSASTTMSVIDANGNGSGRDAGDTMAALSFPGIQLAGCASAILYFNVSSEVAAGTCLVRGQAQIAGPSSRWTSGNLPSAGSMVAATASFSTAPGLKSIDVTAIVQQIMAGAAWAPGGRINFTLEAASASASCNISNYASGLTRLVVVEGDPIVVIPPAPGQLFLPPDPIVVQANGGFQVRVSRNGGDDGAVRVDYAITIANSTPSQPTGTLEFADGDVDDKVVNVVATATTASGLGQVTLSNPRTVVPGGPQPSLGTSTQSISVQVPVAGNPVWIDPDEDIVIEAVEGVPLTPYPLRAEDPLGEPLTYDRSEVDLPGGVTINPSTLVLSGTPVANSGEVGGRLYDSYITAVAGATPPPSDFRESIWQAQRTAPGVALAARLDNLPIILGDGVGQGLLRNGAYDLGLWAFDTVNKAHGAGSLRFDLRDDTTGASGMNWCFFLDGIGARRFNQPGDEFWFQGLFMLNDAAARHYMLTTGDAPGHKIFILDRFKRTGGVKECVILNSRARSYPTSYVGLSVSQAWGNGSVQRPVPGTSDYYRHPGFNDDIPEGTPTWAARQQLHGPVLNNGVANSYQGPLGRGAGIPDPNIGSYVFTPMRWAVVTVRVKINSLNGEDGIYQVWCGDDLGMPKRLIAESDANFRADTVETKSPDDTTTGNLGYSGGACVFFQTDLAADPGRDTMSVWYQSVITHVGPNPPMHPGPNGLVPLPGIL